MKRHLTSIILLIANLLPTLAYDRHGRDYSVNGGSGSPLLMLFLIAFVGIILYVWIDTWFKNKNKK